MPDERWCKKQAINIAALLPDDPDEAKRVLQYAQELVGSFLIGEPPIVKPARPVALKLVSSSDPPEHDSPQDSAPDEGEGTAHSPHKSSPA